MARNKKYVEEEVIEKAMTLFWKKGYETTSMQELESQMGINKFSIYASFGNKNGVFLESLKCYKQQLNRILANLKASDKGLLGIKQYFYDFLEFSKEDNNWRGCLITNTAMELGDRVEPVVKEVLVGFMDDVKSTFAEALAKKGDIDEASVEEQADYLMVAMFGLASASKAFSQSQLHSYIEQTFKKV
ncbi:TetR/AcrR family transcriptional regulator [Echinicola strongylocentroti]|uniref:TetR/AcrR family transcriptional regulator n=1 Tax=Echinicola strongylocentroti TaxID=1795355 RepID=A0A2Z4INS5_9BACT|nr:TetR/AcrR family transcriptional regulator [Echinicola strongylocentroti]AWW32752.1 TetR/AcrR family transcriptional regulator [Echinicola strongylocentroti]